MQGGRSPTGVIPATVGAGRCNMCKICVGRSRMRLVNWPMKYRLNADAEICNLTVNQMGLRGLLQHLAKAPHISPDISCTNTLVPLAGLEPALLAEPDFESGASTDSATGASGGIILAKAAGSTIVDGLRKIRESTARTPGAMGASCWLHRKTTLRLPQRRFGATIRPLWRQ